jgi:H+/Cl- antiporter ClcA
MTVPTTFFKSIVVASVISFLFALFCFLFSPFARLVLSTSKYVSPLQRNEPLLLLLLLSFVLIVLLSLFIDDDDDDDDINNNKRERILCR